MVYIPKVDHLAVWPLCSAAKNMKAAIMSNGDDGEPCWSTFQWKRQLEEHDPQSTRRAPSMANETLWFEWCCLTWNPADTVFSEAAELTDKGRQTTLELGRRLRYLYIHQLHLLPDTLSSSGMLDLRSSPYPRALHSLQQVYTGLYPTDSRQPNLEPPVIVSRRPVDEIVMPNEDFCLRFKDLIKSYSKRAALKCRLKP